MTIAINYIKYVLAFIAIIMAITAINRFLSHSFSEEPIANKEGFTTYFRQIIRPHVRRVGYAKDLVSHHVNKQFGNFGKGLGIF